MDEFLAETPILDCRHPAIAALSSELFHLYGDDISRIKGAFEYVRDRIPHSFDMGGVEVACTASQVLAVGHGICYAKSHLLAAVLRGMGIPAGICYQRQTFLGTSETPKMCLHALNAAYIPSLELWVRFDARGNKPGVAAQFSLDKEQLAFPLDESLGEIDYPEIYASPLPCIIEALETSQTCQILRGNLPEDIYINKSTMS